MRLGGRPGLDVGDQVRVDRPGVLQDPADRCGRRSGRRVQGHRAAELVRGQLERTQYVVGLDLHRLAGDRRGDVRVAVAVAADPGAEPDERRHHRLLDPGRLAGQRVVEPPVDVADDIEQGLLEDGHRRADLVQRGRPAGPQLRRTPEDVDLLDQAALVLGQLAVTGPGVAALLQERRDAPDRRQCRAAPGLGRVRGQHRAELQPVEQRAGLLLAALCGDLLDRLGQLRHRRGVAGAVALPQYAGAVQLLAQVRQVEVAGEGAGDVLGPLVRPGGDQLPRRPHRRRRWSARAVSPRRPAAAGPRTRPGRGRAVRRAGARRHAVPRGLRNVRGYGCGRSPDCRSRSRSPTISGGRGLSPPGPAQ